MLFLTQVVFAIFFLMDMALAHIPGGHIPAHMHGYYHYHEPRYVMVPDYHGYGRDYGAVPSFASAPHYAPAYSHPGYSLPVHVAEPVEAVPVAPVHVPVAVGSAGTNAAAIANQDYSMTERKSFGVGAQAGASLGASSIHGYRTGIGYNQGYGARFGGVYGPGFRPGFGPGLIGGALY